MFFFVFGGFFGWLSGGGAFHVVFQGVLLELSPPTLIQGLGSEETGFPGFCSLEVFCLFVCFSRWWLFTLLWRFRGKQIAPRPPSQREALVCSPLASPDHINSPSATGRARPQSQSLGSQELPLVPKTTRNTSLGCLGRSRLPERYPPEIAH